ncbi:MAG: 5'-methylthioadenosine/adenosylhomocysteine nucleosidase [Campylobacteraceae bacterium]
MKIAIMSAMQEELTPLLEKFKHYGVKEYANNKYYFATYKHFEVILAYSKIGKVNAALTASTLIQKYGAESLLFSGVAGSLNEELKIGDLIAGTSLVQHDLDITAFGHPYGFVPESKVFVEADKALVNIARDVAKSAAIELKNGVIATGDQFVCDNAKKEWIRKTFSADAVEMEGASVAFVCDSLNIPFFILRAISDGAGAGADFDFDTFLASSSKVSADFIISMLDKM